MSQLWYPGRVPFCTDELVQQLSLFVEVLHELTATQDSTRLQMLELIKDDAIVTLDRERRECFGTDATLNNLHQLFNDAMRVSLGAFRSGNWDALFELATNMLVVRDELMEEQEKVTA